MPKLPEMYYAYVWRLQGEVLWVGQGKGHRCNPKCKASWSGRPKSLLEVLESHRNEIEVEVFKNLTKRQSWAMEEKLIIELKPKFNTAPGHGGYSGMHSEQGLVSISLANKGKKHSNEFKRNASNRMLGNKNLLGHKHADETKAKISEAGKGRPVSELTKQKSRERMIERNRLNPPRKGKKCSEEHKRKLSEAKIKHHSSKGK